MSVVHFVFAVHNHQPAGNFDSVFEEAFRHSYEPFLEVLERHPAVKCTQLWTGTLLEWLLRVHPDFVERMGILPAVRVESHRETRPVLHRFGHGD